jgi:hypothetical protein
MSLDRDLGTGEDAPSLLWFLINSYLDRKEKIWKGVPDIKVGIHSANIIGGENLFRLWDSFLDFVNNERKME